MPKIDVGAVTVRRGSGYPRPFDAPCADRTRQRLGNAGGIVDFGVNLMRLPPGGWSSQRHWHSHEDEFVYVLDGELTLVEDGGETILRAGDCAAFPKGTGDGHHMINRSGAVGSGRHGAPLSRANVSFIDPIRRRTKLSRMSIPHVSSPIVRSIDAAQNVVLRPGSMRRRSPWSDE